MGETRFAKSGRRWRQDKIERGLCVGCGQVPSIDASHMCPTCSANHADEQGRSRSLICPRCKLARPERYGVMIRCGCCGRVLYTQLLSPEADEGRGCNPRETGASPVQESNIWQIGTFLGPE